MWSARSTNRQQGKFVQYEINDLCLYRPGFHVIDIPDSSRTVHKFGKVVHVPSTSWLDRRSRNHLLYRNLSDLLAGSFRSDLSLVYREWIVNTVIRPRVEFWPVYLVYHLNSEKFLCISQPVHWVRTLRTVRCTNLWSLPIQWDFNLYKLPTWRKWLGYLAYRSSLYLIPVLCV